ncbi:hypothetical protein A3709_19195 [Halioglobus sp. HI00S01]|uniref:hypothetical protein n=1 Tax=Halioglobus sp. HI00S01 TaxID=1822214 RepID=UPI0007C259D7|nr:hypothetical protein [Halioglobus sp. HI00S01]KZX57750.1 hypothetical protein A3709_19195 [Halioglobus sp. HI00S01]
MDLLKDFDNPVLTTGTVEPLIHLLGRALEHLPEDLRTEAQSAINSVVEDAKEQSAMRDVVDIIDDLKGEEGVLEFDDNAVVSVSENEDGIGIGGFYVQSWSYISISDLLAGARARYSAEAEGVPLSDGAVPGLSQSQSLRNQGSTLHP